MGKSAGSKSGGGGGGGGQGKSTGGSAQSPLTTEQQQIVSFVNGFSEKNAKITPNKTELENIARNGWEGIPNGEIVWVSKFHKGPPREGDSFYRKLDANTIIDQSGKKQTMTQTQKAKMTATYAIQKVVPKPAYG